MAARYGRPVNSRSQTRLATVALLAVTATWGSTFFLIRDLVRTIPPTDFLAVRFAIATVFMVALFWRQLTALTRRQWVTGAGLGGLYGAAQIGQTIGLAHTSASLSGFITGMYVVLTPVFASVLLRDRVNRATWVAVALSLSGLGVLSVRGLDGLSFGLGEWITLLSAGVYALHIIGLGRFSTAESAAGLAVVQIATITVICGLSAVPGGVVLPGDRGGWAAVVYMGVVAGAAAMWAQTWAQAHLSASRAAILMTMEPVFAAGFAVALGGELLTLRIAAGGALIVAAMYVVELGSRADDPAVQLRPAPP